MTFYHEQILRISDEVYPKQYLSDQVIQAKHFIDVRFSQNIDLDDIAGEAYLSKFHFIRLFKKHYGKTPYRYLTEVRIEKAKELLRAGATVTDACFSVGFESVSSFAGLFKKATGSTPLLLKRERTKKQF